VDFVLGKFTSTEAAELEFAVPKAVDMLLSFCTVGPALTMNQFND
jgi:PTH1 family peptidyl-tRNA hydrolase